MLPVAIAPNVSAPPAITLAPNNAFSEATLGRLPPNIVSASIAAPESYNQRQGSAASRPAPEPEFTSAQETHFGLESAQPGNASPIRFGFSTPFLAQLLGQSAPGQSHAITALYSHNVKLPLDDTTWKNYSLVRYKPSDAALPPPPSLREEIAPPHAAAEAAQAIVPVKEEAITSEPAQNIAPQPDITLSITPGTIRLPLSPPALQDAPEIRLPFPPARRSGTVSTRGTEAYDNASVRNEKHGTSQPAPQVAVSL